ncbi:hypothetical protein [Blastococcus sp. TF02A-35]|uniref:hypothetical protein n=1 Tax=Blastococcus sp. TF02A-35 TaxID=2559612 RepID=UPI0010735AF4|nr:hypothetical protein [Blastococcus sp. TF02A_35]TFV53160.1 hypothetical protein E4P43_02905 [Blastococcus sp. TF02A_35]
MSESGDSVDVGTEYAEYFSGLSQAQEARKASLEQRGLAVITTSGALATLLFGLTALVSGAEGFDLPRQAGGPLGVALVAFAVAALLALLTNVPLPYANAALGDTADELRVLWSKGREHALKLITGTRVKMLKRARAMNDVKAWLLIAAMLAEVIGVGAVAVAVGEVLRHG